jgi:hypothetical protein
VTQRAWILVTTAYVIGALGLLIAIAMVQEQAQSLERSRDTLSDLAINVTASICLQAFAPEEREPDLIVMYVEGREILIEEPVCLQAVKRAREQIEEAKE